MSSKTFTTGVPVYIPTDEQITVRFPWDYSINEEDIQAQAQESIGRDLTDAELTKVTTMLDHSLNDEVMERVRIAIDEAKCTHTLSGVCIHPDCR